VDSGTQTANDEQIGGGSQPFMKMSFDTFDRINSKKPRTNKKRKWMSFSLEVNLITVMHVFTSIIIYLLCIVCLCK